MSKNYELLAALKADSYTEEAPFGRAEATAEDEVPYQVADSSIIASRDGDGSSILYSEFNNLIQRLFLGSERGTRSVVFCGVDEKSGTSSSWVCAQAAEALAARIDRLVCVVRTPGFNDIDATPTSIRTRVSTSFDEHEKQLAKNLFTSYLKINASRTDSSRNNTSAALRDLHNRFEYVIIDAPSISNGGEAEAFGRWSDGVVLVVEALSTRRQVALRTVEKLRSAGIKVLGTVVNNRTFPIPEGIYRRL
jgi:protein-tyrosine kinase